MKRTLIKVATFGLVLALGVNGAVYATTQESVPTASTAKLGKHHAQPITVEDVLQAQKEWGDGIVEIGKIFTAGGDYKAAASKFIDHYYAYGDGKVLFKPTRAAADQFRETKEGALSYFVTGIDKEDHGFAIQPWSKVRFENSDVDIENGDAIALGNYFFTDAKTNEEVKVEFTFGYKRAKDGHLEIFLHHSSIPYQVAH
ncbi:MAG: hypothetical protein ACP5Q0_03855 [Halothiobacillus sp.]